MLAIGCLIFDCMVHEFAGTWLTAFTTWHLLYTSAAERVFYRSLAWYTAFFAYLIVDFMQTGYVGLSVVYLLFYILFITKARQSITSPGLVLSGIGLVGYLFFQKYAVYSYFMGINESWRMTFFKISTNLLVAFFALVGRLGSRLFFVSARSRRKVWTPNRKSAS